MANRRLILVPILLSLAVWGIFLAPFCDFSPPERQTPPVQAPTSAPAPVALSEEAVVLVDTDTGMGSATAIRKGTNFTVFVTAKHVLESYDAINIRVIINGELVTASRIERHETLDVALIFVASQEAQISPVDPAPLKFGDPLTTCGYTAGVRFLTSGFASGGGFCSCDVNSGMSGGGVFRDGRLVGVVAGMLVSRRGFNESPVYFAHIFTPLHDAWPWIQDILN
jgi:S1-C subfamily serine protease